MTPHCSTPPAVAVAPVTGLAERTTRNPWKIRLASLAQAAKHDSALPDSATGRGRAGHRGGVILPVAVEPDTGRATRVNHVPEQMPSKNVPTLR